jgi:hypothetical protein
MTGVPYGRLAAVPILALVLVPLLADSPGARAQAPGDLWQVTTKMSMPGMSMPGQSSQVCAAKQWTKPPGGEREGCTTSGFAMRGNTATWDVMCTGQQTMTGHGEIMRDGNGFKGTIKFSAEGFAMTIELEGQRTGDCSNPQ